MDVNIRGATCISDAVLLAINPKIGLKLMKCSSTVVLLYVKIGIIFLTCTDRYVRCGKGLICLAGVVWHNIS